MYAYINEESNRNPNKQHWAKSWLFYIIQHNDALLQYK